MATRDLNAHYIGADGKESLYDLIIPDNWNQRLIVFLHGYMGYKDWGAWNLVADYFVERNYGFLKYNVSHNGGTLENPIDFDDLEAFSKNTYSKEIEDLQAILKKIGGLFDEMPDVYLIGHSRGGGIALLQSDDARVKKIASWAGICSIEDRFPKDKELDAWKEDGFYFRKNGRTAQTMPHHFSQYEDFIANKDRLNIRKHCETSTTPTLVIHGADDDSVSITEGKNIARWLSQELVTIDGAQHTFNTSQPWPHSDLSNELKEVCDLTYRFFEEDDIRTFSGEKEKLSLLSDLIKLARVDNDLREVEYNFLMAIAKQLGVSQEAFDLLFEEYIDFNPPPLEIDRIVQFQRIILLMNVDMETSESELEMVRSLGMHMGLNPLAVNEVLKTMNDYRHKVIPPDKLLAIFKVFHN